MKDRAGGLEKKPAEFWEDAYWKSIQRYPEMNARYQKQQEEIAELYQTINKLGKHLLTLDGFTEQYFRVNGQTIYFDFLGLRARLVQQRQYIDTLKDNYQNAVQLLAELRNKYERPNQSGRTEGDAPVERRALRTSKYL